MNGWDGQGDILAHKSNLVLGDGVEGLVKGDKVDKDELKGRFSVTKKNDPARIADRVKKAKLKT